MTQQHDSRLTTQLALRNDNGRQEPRIHRNDTTCSSNISNSYDKKTTSQPHFSSSFSDVTSQAQPSPPSTNDFFSSNVLPAKRQPLQQHSFNAPAPATASTAVAAAAAAAAALPLEPFRNPASIDSSPQQREHQRQPEKQQQRTCIVIEQLIQAQSSTRNIINETVSRDSLILNNTTPRRQRQETSGTTS
jgi:hypothetical protein